MLAQKAHGLLSEIEQLLWRDFQHLAKLENHVKGYAHVAKLDGADVASVNIHQLRKLKLGQLFSLAIIHYIQAELFVIRFILRLHAPTPLPHILFPF